MIENNAQIEARNERVDGLSKNDLRKSLMGYGYFPEANIFPPIHKITHLKKGEVSKVEADPINLFVTKSSKRWREFKLLRPENYMRVVDTLTDHYTDIQKLFKQSNRILSYSQPIEFQHQSQRPGRQILNWFSMQEDMLESASQNRLGCLVEIDVQNCYETLYTHTLEWAAGRKIGRKLDESIRSGNLRRTHGLPIGPYVSDVLSEIVLCWIDKKIEKSLNNTSYLGYRFRDNYYILCKGLSEGEKVASVLAEELRNAHFSINDDKTHIGPHSDYHLSRWQTEHKLLIQSLGLKNYKSDFTNEKLQVFIAESQKISSKINHSSSVLEKTVNIITNGNFTGIIDYRSLFFSVSEMLPLRTLSYPKILTYLKKLSLEHPAELSAIFEKFLTNEVEDAYMRKDIYAMMWLSYIMYDTPFVNTKAKILLYLKRQFRVKKKNKFLGDMILFLEDPKNSIELWPKNKSLIQFSRHKYFSVEELYDYLGVSFAES